MKLKDMLHKINEEELINVDKKSFNKEETIRAIRQSKMAELDAINMYTQIAQATKIPSVKRVFESIVNEERRHSGEFSELLKKLGVKDDDFAQEGRQEAQKEM